MGVAMNLALRQPDDSMAPQGQYSNPVETVRVEMQDPVTGQWVAYAFPVDEQTGMSSDTAHGGSGSTASATAAAGGGGDGTVPASQDSGAGGATGSQSGSSEGTSANGASLPDGSGHMTLNDVAIGTAICVGLCVGGYFAAELTLDGYTASEYAAAEGVAEDVNLFQAYRAEMAQLEN